MATADEYAAWIVQNEDKKGTPDFETVVAAYKAAKATPVQEPKQASWGKVVGSAPYKALAGTADLLLNAPYNVANLGKAAYGAATTALGRKDLAPEIQPPPDFARRGLQSAGLITPTPNMSPTQRVVDIGLQAATGGALNPAESVRQMAANVAKGGIAGLTGQTTTEVTGSPLAGLAVSVATPAAIEASTRARQASLRLQQAKNLTRDETLTEGQKLGFQVTPGSVNPSAQNVIAERIAGKTRVEQNMSVHNQQVVDDAARRALGLPEGAPLIAETTKAVRAAEYKLGYEPITAIGPVATDGVFKQALKDLESKFTGAAKSFPGAAPNEVKRLAKIYSVDSFDAADALPAIQSLRDAARGNFVKGDNGLGKAQMATSKALEDQIERSLVAANNPQATALLEQFRASRQRMAVSHAVEDALHVGSGSVDAKKLASDIQSGKLLTGELEIAAKFANTFKNVTKPPSSIGTPGAGAMLGSSGWSNVLGGAMGAGVGWAHGGGLGMAAGAGAGNFLMPMAAQMVSSGTRNYLQSKFAQQRALPDYASGDFLSQQVLNPQLRNALIGVTQSQNQLGQ